MELKNKRILVTGANGFIGSHIIRALSSEGSLIFGISLDNEFDWRLKDIECNCAYINLLNEEKLNSYIHEVKPEIILHLSAYVNAERDFHVVNQMIDVNLKGTINLLSALQDFDYELFINTGSGEEYGDNQAPFEEGQKENPVSPYSASKVASTYFCGMVKKIFQKPIITVRPFLVYGETQISRMLIPWLIYSGITQTRVELTPGDQTRDFIHVKDVANAFLAIIRNFENINDPIINIGTGIRTKVIDVVEILKSTFPDNRLIVGGKNYRTGEAMKFYPDISKIRSTTGWKAEIGLEEGLNNTISWWRSNTNWKKYANIWK